MFRPTRLIVLVGLGFYLGYTFHANRSEDKCLDQSGNWTGTLCLITE